MANAAGEELSAGVEGVFVMKTGDHAAAAVVIVVVCAAAAAIDPALENKKVAGADQAHQACQSRFSGGPMVPSFSLVEKAHDLSDDLYGS